MMGGLSRLALLVSISTFVSALSSFYLYYKYYNQYDLISFSVVVAIFLPFLNAAFDWFSWGVARIILGRAIQHANNLWGMFSFLLDLLAALMVGLLCLPVLAAALANGLSIANWLFSVIGHHEIDWLSRLTQAAVDPWGAGLVVSGMLLTTLLPVFLAVVAGFSGLFFAWNPNTQQLAQQIPYDPTLKEQEEMSEVFKDKLQGALLRARLWYVPATLLTLALFAGLFEAFSYTIQPYGHFLADVARCSTVWSHGQCAWGTPTSNAP